MGDEYTPQAWRLTDYYPDSYAKFMSALGIGFDYDDDDFDKYEAEFLADLAEYTASVLESARNRLNGHDPAGEQLQRMADEKRNAGREDER